MAKVLVVEDNPLDYKMISDPLIDGYELDHAENLDQAKNFLRENNFGYNLILFDLLSKEGESELFRDFNLLIFFLRKAESDKETIRIPIIIITGHSTDSTELSSILTKYPGWIWGWHSKKELDDLELQTNVENTVESYNELRKAAENTKKEQDAWGLKQKLMGSSSIALSYIIGLITLIIVIFIGLWFDNRYSDWTIGISTFAAGLMGMFGFMVGYKHNENRGLQLGVILLAGVLGITVASVGDQIKFFVFVPILFSTIMGLFQIIASFKDS